MNTTVAVPDLDRHSPPITHPTAGIQASAIDELLEQLRERLAELPELFIASRTGAMPAPAVPTIAAGPRPEARADELRRAILWGRGAGLLLGGFVFRMLGAWL
jgi:hypothetical protein